MSYYNPYFQPGVQSQAWQNWFASEQAWVQLQNLPPAQPAQGMRYQYTCPQHPTPPASESDRTSVQNDVAKEIQEMMKANVPPWRLVSHSRRPNPSASSFEPTSVRRQQNGRNKQQEEALRSVHSYARYPDYRVNKLDSRGNERHKQQRKKQHPAHEDRDTQTSQQATDRHDSQTQRGPNANPVHDFYTSQKRTVPAFQHKTPRDTVSEFIQVAQDNTISQPRMTRGMANQARQHGQPVTFYAGRGKNHYKAMTAYGEPLPSIEPSEDIIAPTKGQSQQLQNNELRLGPDGWMSVRRTASPPAPEATQAYLEQARAVPVKSDVAKKLLVVLDLNGTLLVRPRKSNTQSFRIRPGVPAFLKYLFENHVVMVYTSTRPVNAEAMVNTLLTDDQRKRLAAIWARDKLGLTRAQYNDKVQVYKKLDKIWRDKRLQTTHPDKAVVWDQSNTVLIDDSHLKALAQPHNLVLVPEFKKEDIISASSKKHQVAIAAVQTGHVRTLQAKLEELKYQTDVSQLIHEWNTKKSNGPVADVYETISDDEVADIALQLLSPEDSTVENSSDSNTSSGSVLVEYGKTNKLGKVPKEFFTANKIPGLDLPPPKNSSHVPPQKRQPPADAMREESIVSEISEGDWLEVLDPDGTKSTRYVRRSRQVATCMQ